MKVFNIDQKGILTLYDNEQPSKERGVELLQSIIKATEREILNIKNTLIEHTELLQTLQNYNQDAVIKKSENIIGHLENSTGYYYKKDTETVKRKRGRPHKIPITQVNKSIVI